MRAQALGDNRAIGARRLHLRSFTPVGLDAGGAMIRSRACLAVFLTAAVAACQRAPEPAATPPSTTAPVSQTTLAPSRPRPRGRASSPRPTRWRRRPPPRRRVKRPRPVPRIGRTARPRRVRPRRRARPARTATAWIARRRRSRSTSRPTSLAAARPSRRWPASPTVIASAFPRARSCSSCSRAASRPRPRRSATP